MNIKKLLLWGFIWRALFSLSLFILNIAFARYFGALESGKVYFITNTLSLYIIISSLNIETGIGFYAAGKKVNINRLILTAFLLTAISVLGLLVLQKIPLFTQYLSGQSWPWYYSVFYVAGNLLASVFCALFYAYNNYLFPNIILAGCMFLLSLFFFVNQQYFISGTEDSLYVYFVFFALQALILIAGFFYVNRRELSFKNTRDQGHTIIPVLKYSLIALISNIFFFLLYRLDYWFVEYYASAPDLGNYIQASKFGQALLIAPSIFSIVILPRIAEGSIKKFEKPAAFAFITLIFLYLFCFLFLLLTGPAFFEMLMGPEYIHMYWPSVIKIPAILFLSLSFILGTWFSGTNRVKYNTYCTIAGIIIISVSDFLLIPAYGIIGASFASLLAYIAVFATSVYLYHAKTNQSFTGILRVCISIVKDRKRYIKALWANLRITND